MSRKEEENEKSDPKNEEKDAKTPPNSIVFVATYPDRVGRQQPFLDEIDKQPNVILLHPSYNFMNDEGQSVLDMLPSQEIPQSENHWENLMRKDFFAIEQSDLLIYDLDIDPGNQFLTAAGIYRKPIIGVSEVFKAFTPYFSGICVGIVKHAELIDFMIFVINHNKLFQKIKKKEKGDPKKVKSIKETIEKVEMRNEGKGGRVLRDPGM